jgi:short-subunit dehydrogenase
MEIIMYNKRKIIKLNNKELKEMKKIAIVTGASSGLGIHFIRQLDQKYELDEIWMIARRKDKMEEVKRKLRKAKGIIIPLDLAEPKNLEVINNKLKQEKPDVKFLINNAGYGKIGFFSDNVLDSQLGMIDVNIRPLVALSHLTIPYMKKGAKIIQTASSAAYLPQPGFTVYAATKAFVLSFSKALAVELKSKQIHVLAVCPGPVKTEFFQIASQDGKPLDWKTKFMAEPKFVVAQALKDVENKKLESVYGGYIKAFKVLAKILPHGWILKTMKWK